MNLSMCKRRRGQNLDNEEEGVLLTNCAGGARVHSSAGGGETEKKQGCRLPTDEIGGRQAATLPGAEKLIRGRANANCLMGGSYISAEKVRFMSVEGGSADNAIPSASRGGAFAEQDNCADLEDSLGQLENTAEEYTVTDSGIRMVLEKDRSEWEVFTEEAYLKRRRCFSL